MDSTIFRTASPDSSLDIDSILACLDDDATDFQERQDALDTNMNEPWDVVGSPQAEIVTPNMLDIDSPARPEPKDQDEVEFAGPDFPKYGLRPQRREQKSTFTRTWIDRDESGDYDPTVKLRKARPRCQVKSRFRSEDDFESEGNDESCTDTERPESLLPKLGIKLTFQSETTRLQFQEITNSPPTTATAPSEDVNFNGYRLRKRGAAPSTRYYGECNLDKSQVARDLPDDLTGHPTARGCWECLAVGNECPLLLDERSWPCATCIDDGHDCDLVTPPKYKRTCERCKRRKTSCSYVYTEEHGEACQQCMDDGYRCVAGPAKDTIQQRIRYDRDWEKDPMPKYKPFKARKAPTLAEHGITDSPQDTPMRDVRGAIDEDDCTVDDLSPHSVGVPNRCADNELKKILVQRDRPVPSRPQHIGTNTKGTTRTIETKFCHPIIFNHENKAMETACNFCDDARYSILGLENKKVEVIDWQDGRGLEEISGGHRGEGVENTRVCISCTTERIPIIMCRTHELKPLELAKKDKLDENDAFSELLTGSGKLKGKWCSICINLAEYECCTPADDGAGCGLLVCEHCMVVLSGMYDGDLQKMVPRLKNEPSAEQMLGLRADYEFLEEAGLLMRYVLWNSEQ